MYSRITAATEKYRKLMFDVERYVWKNPETGFREWKTSKYLADIFKSLGYSLTMAGDIPGFYTDIDTGEPGPKILVLGEMDALICAEHPEADPDTHAVHCCGYNGSARHLWGLRQHSGRRACLTGYAARAALRGAGRGGDRDSLPPGVAKRNYPLLAARQVFAPGYFDGVDIAFMIHTTPGERL